MCCITTSAFSSNQRIRKRRVPFRHRLLKRSSLIKTSRIRQRSPTTPLPSFSIFDQLDYYYRVPGEFTHRLNGDEYGFESLSFIITETHPGGGPGLHVHDTEEAHVLLEGTTEY